MARPVHVLVLELLLVLTALTEPDVFVEEEQEAILTCDKVQDGQKRCNKTTWIYINPKISNPAVEVITLGKLGPDPRYKDKVTLTESCSLVFKNPQIQQNGNYTCRQYDEALREVSDASIMLSVVSLTEHVNSEEVKLNCYLTSPHACKTVQVNLLYNGTQVKTDQTSVTVRSYLCGASASFRPEFFSTKRRELFSCEISHENRRYLFKLREKPTEKPLTNETNNRGGGGGASPAFSVWWWWTVPVFVAGAALTLTAVILVKRRKKKERLHGNNIPEPSTLTVQTEPEDGVSYASVSYTRKKESTPEPGLSEDDTVTYSSVNIPELHKINPLYASVGKH